MYEDLTRVLGTLPEVILRNLNDASSVAKIKEKIAKENLDIKLSLLYEMSDFVSNWFEENVNYANGRLYFERGKYFSDFVKIALHEIINDRSEEKAEQCDCPEPKQPVVEEHIYKNNFLTTNDKEVLDIIDQMGQNLADLEKNIEHINQKKRDAIKQLDIKADEYRDVLTKKLRNTIHKYIDRYNELISNISMKERIVNELTPKKIKFPYEYEIDLKPDFQKNTLENAFEFKSVLSFTKYLINKIDD